MRHRIHICTLMSLFAAGTVLALTIDESGLAEAVTSMIAHGGDGVRCDFIGEEAWYGGGGGGIVIIRYELSCNAFMMLVK